MTTARDWIEEEADRRVAEERAAGVATDPTFTVLAARTIRTAAERAAAERAAQGLPTPAAPTGDPIVDARVAAAYRTTATVLASAMATPDGVPSTSPAAGVAIGAAAVGRGSAAASRSNKQKAADADTSTASQTAAGG